jgi:NDP-sugar pyrophosphorylase family protein
VVAVMRRAVILAGGLGMRLRPYTTVLPKPLMPVGDRPILDVIIRQLKHQGFDRLTIVTGHLAELIEAFFGSGARHGIPIDYFREDEPLGTVGALSLIDDLDEDFLVMNGDVLTDLPFAELLDRHADSGAAATIAAHRREVRISLGVLGFDDSGDPERLTGYVEKPTYDYEVSMGVYAFSRRVLRFIEPGQRLDFPDLVLRLIEAGETVRARRSTDYWLDIGRHDDYETAMDEFERLRTRFLPGEPEPE